MKKLNITQYNNDELINQVINDEHLNTQFENTEESAEDFICNTLEDFFEYDTEQESAFIEYFEEEHKTRLQVEELDAICDTDIKTAVKEWIESKAQDYDDIKNIFSDLLQGGCASGIVSELIYYADTEAFFDTHEDEIWELAEEQAQEMGEANALQFLGTLNGSNNVGNTAQFKNLCAWYAFEETARNLAYELELDI